MQNWETLRRSRIENILIIRLWSAAEILAATPLARVLRDCFPEARISFLLEERFSELLAGCPFIDQIISWRVRGEQQTIKEFFDLYRKVKKQHYDIIIDLQGEKRSRLLTFLSRAGFRIGYESPDRGGKAYNIRREVSPIKKHLVLSYLDLVRELIGCSGNPLDLSLFVAQDRENQTVPAAQDIPEGGKRVLIHPAGERPAEVWPGEKFAQLADRLIQEYGVNIIIAGSDEDGDRERVKQISQLMSLAGHITYHSTWRQLISLLNTVDIFVGHDSGPMHIAAALGKRVVALFGPSDPRVRHPWGSGHEVVWHQFPCSPCDRNDCFKGAGGCMASIEVAEVLEAVAGFLSNA
ncbi:MAG: glycosyltransferase family 9 protein [bacterium]